MLGNTLFKANMFDDALNIWKEALKYDKTQALIYANISAAYLSLSNYAEAIAFANEALLIDPKCEDAYILLSQAKKSTLDIKGIKNNLKNALAINPKN